MSGEFTSSSEDLDGSERVAEQHLLIATDWADLVATEGTAEQIRWGAIALSNPIVYQRDIDRLRLPADLREEWSDLQNLSEAIAKIANVEKRHLSETLNGLEKMQYLMGSDLINPWFRGSISDVIRYSAEVFSASIVKVPGNTIYHREKVQIMGASILRYRQPAAS